MFLEEHESLNLRSQHRECSEEMSLVSSPLNGISPLPFLIDFRDSQIFQTHVPCIHDQLRSFVDSKKRIGIPFKFAEELRILAVNLSGVFPCRPAQLEDTNAAWNV